MIKAVLLHHNFIKISSCVMGYALWTFLANYQTITINKSIPICFYQADEQCEIVAPEFVELSLSGKRKDIYLSDLTTIAIHIDASQYQEGKHHLQLTRKDLFLPDYIHLYRINPSYFSIKVIKKQKIPS